MPYINTNDGELAEAVADTVNWILRTMKLPHSGAYYWDRDEYNAVDSETGEWTKSRHEGRFCAKFNRGVADKISAWKYVGEGARMSDEQALSFVADHKKFISVYKKGKKPNDNRSKYKSHPNPLIAPVISDKLTDEGIKRIEHKERVHDWLNGV